MNTTQHRDHRRAKLPSAAKISLCAIACCFAPFALCACSSTEVGSAATGEARQAVEGADCGYSVSADVHGVSKKGFNARILVSNVDGITSAGFSVLIKSGAAQLTHVAHGSFQVVESGYLLSPLDSVGSSQVDPGQTYTFDLNFDGEYSALDAYVISNNGVACDQASPSLKLSASSDFFTSNGALTLSADATDNVAVAKVVFSQDGEVIGSDTVAPYSLTVPVSSSLNGRHRFTATAYDLTGNQASETKRVLVAIGNKFFGTAATKAEDYASLLAHFNQVTPGNAGKWGTVESTHDQMNWTDLDTAYQFAKANHLPFKLHTLVWGQQQPAWVAALPAEEQLAEIEQWMTALADRYPDVELIDVVNEPLHAAPSYAAALGGAGVTGWDWVIKAFEMARAHFPNSELILNDYSILTMASTTQNYLTIVNLLKDRGLIDGIGEQGHFYERAPDLAAFTANLGALAATGLPLYISELDLNFADDARQANRMKELFTIIWSNPSVVGVTHWGFRQGSMWQSNAYLVRTDGTSRPALTWIECFKAGGANCTVPTYVPQPRVGDSASITLEAEEYDAAHALFPAGNVVAYASNGSWLEFDKVAFVDQWNTINVAYAQGGSSTVNLTIHLDSLDSAPVATIPLAPTGSWSTTQTATVPYTPVVGQHNVFVRFTGGANVDKIQFAAPAPAGKNLIGNGTFESGTAGWSSWGGATLSASNLRAHGGAQSLLVTRTGNSPAATDVTGLVKSGTTYPFSLWVSIHSPDGLAKAINVTQAATCKNSDGSSSTAYKWIGGPVTIASDATWTQISGNLVVPACNLTQVQFWVEGSGPDQLFVDDVQLLDFSGPAANLIPDGSFESGKGAWGGWGYTNLAVTNTSSHSGVQSLMGTGLSKNAAIARDIKALVIAGKRYQASAWVSVGNLAAGSGAVRFQTVQRCNGATSDSYPWLAGTTVGSGIWAQLSGVVNLSACTSVDKLQLFVGADAGNLYLDDVSLTVVP